MPTREQSLGTVERLRAFEGKTIREAAQALGRCTEQVSRLCKKHNINLLVRETDSLPRKRLKSGRLQVCVDALTPDMLREWLDYDPLTGVFVWKKSHVKKHVGKVAGCVKGDGYISIGFFGINFNAHRLAWFYTYGEWPREFIDHIDGNQRNNAISNLREVSPLQSVWNRRCRGYYRDSRTGKYRSQINVHGRRFVIGDFDTPESARAAYLAASEKFFGQFSVVNSRKEVGHA